jgi:streptogramin lyase
MRNAYAWTLLTVLLAACGGGGGSSTPPNLPPATATPSPVPGTIVEYVIPTANSEPGAIAQGPDGNMWFLEDASTNKIGKITPSGVITEYTLPTTNAFPSGLVSGPDGNLWYDDENTPPDLGKVTTSGTITLYTMTAGSIALAVGPDKNLWAPEFNGGNVDVYSTSGTLLHSFPSGQAAGTQLEAVVAGSDGNTWVDPFGCPCSVEKVSPSTGASTLYALPASIQNSLRGIASGPDGNIWVAAQDSNDIVRINISTGVATTFPIPSANSDVYGITADSTYLWFTEPGNNLTGYTNKIGKLNPSTGTITEYPIPTAASYPYGIAVLSTDGTIWFTEANTNKIGRLYPL